ncbi:DNA cytosine methyltransferase [Polymorphospora sp. NPDC050346]|uniref:DNA cytosine methyltransferase n=1 Tax=Polymorphospora sp. NPDC050346 TaxID=3155780 RepID=UPI0033E1078C
MIPNGSVLIDPSRDHSRLVSGWERSPLGLMLPARPRRRYARPVAVELFCGAGGIGLGLHQAGYHVAAASDAWDTAAITYMVNLARPGVKIHFDTPERGREFEATLDRRFGLVPPGRSKRARRAEPDFRAQPVAGSGWIADQPLRHPGCEHFFLGDIRNFTGQQILDALGLEPGEVDLVAGGPPCQGFSQAGRQDIMDPRNTLIFEFARLVTEIQPTAFMMENVPGMLSMRTPEGIPVVDAFCHAVAGGGYGEYEALRKALGAAGPQARAGLRHSATPAKPTRKRKPEPSGDTLFDLENWG